MGIEYTLEVEQDDIPVRGNAFSSGDDAEDRRVEDEILARLDDGDVWAWASVCVVARAGSVEGRAYLGGCSYRDEKEFCQPGGYYAQLKAEALADLERKVAEAAREINSLV